MSGTKKIIWPQKQREKKNTMDPYDGNDSISFDISKSQSQKFIQYRSLTKNHD